MSQLDHSRHSRIPACPVCPESGARLAPRRPRQPHWRVFGWLPWAMAGNGSMAAAGRLRRRGDPETTWDWVVRSCGSAVRGRKSSVRAFPGRGAGARASIRPVECPGRARGSPAGAFCGRPCSVAPHPHGRVRERLAQLTAPILAITLCPPVAPRRAFRHRRVFGSDVCLRSC